MTITCMPMDATAGDPDYTATNYRQSQAAQHGDGVGRPLGGRSGFRIGTPSNILTATSTTWTLVPCSAMIDPGASTHQGMYGWATDQNVSAADIVAADATYARKDIVYIKINDSSSGDGSGALSAPVAYRAGTASADPEATKATLQAREFLVGTITVPQSGGGSPTVVLNPARYVAAGARLPIESATVRAALTPYKGMEILRTDLTQADACGVVERYNGSNWDHFGRAEWTTLSNGISSGALNANLGAFTAVTGKTTDSAFVTIVAGGGIQARDAGNYIITIVQKWSTSVGTNRAFISVEDSSGTTTNLPFARTNWGNSEDTTSVSFELSMTAGQTVYPKVFQAVGTLNVSGVVRVKRVP